MLLKKSKRDKRKIRISSFYWLTVREPISESVGKRQILFKKKIEQKLKGIRL